MGPNSIGTPNNRAVLWPQISHPFQSRGFSASWRKMAEAGRCLCSSPNLKPHALPCDPKSLPSLLDLQGSLPDPIQGPTQVLSSDPSSCFLYVPKPPQNNTQPTTNKTYETPLLYPHHSQASQELTCMGSPLSSGQSHWLHSSHRPRCPILLMTRTLPNSMKNQASSTEGPVSHLSSRPSYLDL